MNNPLLAPDLEHIARIATGIREPLLASVLTAQTDSLASAVGGRRLLVLGAAGFIARQTLDVLLPFEPAYVGLVDVSENGLAEVIRDLRSGDRVASSTVVEPWLVDVTTPAIEVLIDRMGLIDRVLNFAAVKHVRSERDVLSLLRLLQVNLVATYHVTRAIRDRNPACAQFVVSTDKAADPAGFMGASKRAMEIAAVTADPNVTSTRFANVAFSSGSLLESWLRRLALGQPVAVPADTWRYFVTPAESGQLCALASIAPGGNIVIPEIGAERLVELGAVLDQLLSHLGMTGERVTTAREGWALLREAGATDMRYPVIVTPRDTAGEKREEKFLGAGETAIPWLPPLRTMSLTPDPESTAELVRTIRDHAASPDTVTLDQLHAAVSRVVPEFVHVPGGARLDDRI